MRLTAPDEVTEDDYPRLVRTWKIPQDVDSSPDVTM